MQVQSTFSKLRPNIETTLRMRRCHNIEYSNTSGLLHPNTLWKTSAAERMTVAESRQWNTHSPPQSQRTIAAYHLAHDVVATLNQRP